MLKKKVIIIYRVYKKKKERERHGFNPWVKKIPWRRARQPTPVFLPGESHGQRSLAGYSPKGCKEPPMAEATDRTHAQPVNRWTTTPKRILKALISA